MAGKTTNVIDSFTELVITQKLQHEEVMKEIAGVKSDVKSISDGITAQLVEHRLEIEALKTFNQTRVSEEKLKFWNDSAIWVDHYRSRWKWIAAMIGFASMVATYAIDHILPQVQVK